MKIIFVGTPEFGAIVLEGLIKGGYRPILVITAPDKPVGRKQILTPPPVKLLASKYGIPISQPKEIRNSKSEIRKLEPDLIVVAAYGQILPKEILDIPKFGCLNIHPSLLPKYRGPSPIQFTILEGDDKTGVTVIKMTEKVDAGPVLAQKEIELNGKEFYTDLHNKLAELGGKLLTEIIPKWIEGKIKAILQDETKATYSKILKKEDGRIDWKKPAKVIERQVRAFNPWPGTFTLFTRARQSRAKGEDEATASLTTRATAKAKRTAFSSLPSPRKRGSVGEKSKILKILKAQISEKNGKKLLVIEKVLLEGKKPMSFEDFLRGYPDFVKDKQICSRILI